MKVATSVILALVCLCFAPLALADQGLVQDLERTRDRFLKSVEGLTEEQWNWKAAPERWSIAECAEHIAASESFIRGAVSGALKEPAPADLLAEARKDDAVKGFTTDRSKKFTAPEPLQPSNRYESPAAAVESFRTERAQTLELAGGDTDFRAYALAHPGFGPLDAYGWLLFLSLHSERHTLQIEEVKATEGFPK